MTTVVPVPDHLLTLEEWIALPEDNSRKYELVEGVLSVSPRPVVRHQYAIWRLAAQLHPQLSSALRVVTEAEVVINPSSPPTVRVPDVMVVQREVLANNLARVTPDDVLLVVEILSPGSKRTDRVTKFAEYAEVGIEYYWLVDLDDPVSLTAYRLINGEYENVGERTGRAMLELDGMSVTVDLSELIGD